MPVVIFVILSVIATYFITTSQDRRTAGSIRMDIPDLNASRTFVPTNWDVEPTVLPVDSDSGKSIANREIIETSLMRTCRVVSTIAHSNGCSDWKKSTFVWGFLGGAENGKLSTIYNQPTSTTLAANCNNVDKYARGLFVNSVPLSVVSAEDLKYDKKGFDNNYNDPCGYIDLIGK